MFRRILIALGMAAALFGQEQQQSAEQWIKEQIKDKDLPEWARDNLVTLDQLIQDEETRIFYRRFLLDGRTDGLIKFSEYQAQFAAEEIVPSDIYKGIYFALTYTLMDGLPYGPLYEEAKTQHEGIQQLSSHHFTRDGQPYQERPKSERRSRPEPSSTPYDQPSGVSLNPEERIRFQPVTSSDIPRERAPGTYVSGTPGQTFPVTNP